MACDAPLALGAALRALIEHTDGCAIFVQCDSAVRTLAARCPKPPPLDAGDVVLQRNPTAHVRGSAVPGRCRSLPLLAWPPVAVTVGSRSAAGAGLACSQRSRSRWRNGRTRSQSRRRRRCRRPERSRFQSTGSREAEAAAKDLVTRAAGRVGAAWGASCARVGPAAHESSSRFTDLS